MNIYLDCSRIYVFGGNHGIPRVVRNIINNIPEDSKHNLIPVVINLGNFKKVNKIRKKSESILKYIKIIKNFISKIKKNKKTPTVNEFKQNKALAYNLFSTILLFFNKTVTPKSGDVFITTDNFFISTFPDVLKKLRKNGVIIGSIQYDLIPVRYSQFYPDEDIISYKSHLNNSIKLCDFCICISEYVKKDLIDYYLEQNILNKNITNKIKFNSFRLGFNLDNESTENIYNDKLKEIFNRPTYIIVSTIEPRKNHSYLLNAFEKIWNSGIEVNLLIIGKIGWLVEETLERITGHKEYNKKLFMMNNISDSELLYCYKNAKALITPSITEGFGLPIIEALSQKTPVLASDIPVFREVGGNFCNYFDLSSPDNLSRIIIDWEKTGNKPVCQEIDKFSWPTWEESTRELIDKIIELSK